MTTLVVQKDRIKKNAAVIAGEVAPAKIIGVVKGNGYGLGLVPLARILGECGVTMLAVANLAEAVALREAGITCDVLLLSPLLSPADAEVLLEHQIIATVCSYDSAVMLSGIAEAAHDVAKVHIKVDTGFGRFGFDESETDRIISIANFMRSIDIVGIYTHLYNSFGKNEQSVKLQYDAFKKVLDVLKGSGVDIPMRHMANSCAALRFEETRLDAVRIGSAFLGRLPIHDKWGLEKVGYLEDVLSEIRWLKKGHNIGYGGVYKTKRPVRTAVIQTGYGSGFSVERTDNAWRFLDIARYIWRDIKRLSRKNRPYVVIGQKKAPVLGRVSMCNMVVDVTDIECSPGDIVTMPVNPLLVDSLTARRYE